MTSLDERGVSAASLSGGWRRDGYMTVPRRFRDGDLVDELGVEQFRLAPPGNQDRLG